MKPLIFPESTINLLAQWFEIGGSSTMFSRLILSCCWNVFERLMLLRCIFTWIYVRYVIKFIAITNLSLNHHVAVYSSVPKLHFILKVWTFISSYTSNSSQVSDLPCVLLTNLGILEAVGFGYLTHQNKNSWLTWYDAGFKFMINDDKNYVETGTPWLVIKYWQQIIRMGFII